MIFPPRLIKGTHMALSREINELHGDSRWVAHAGSAMVLKHKGLRHFSLIDYLDTSFHLNALF